MGQAQIGSLVVSLEANMAKFTSDMERSAKTTENAMSRIQSGVNLVKGALVALGAAAAVEKLVEGVHGVIEYADHLNDLSKSTGLAIETLDGLSLTAKQSGTDLDGLADSISKLSVNMGKDAEKYRALGITAKDPIEAFKQLSDIFVGIQDPQLRAALGAEALGKSWKSSAPVLAEGSKSIGEMIQKGHDLSGVTKETAEMADKFNDSMAELEAAQTSLSRELARDLLPSLSAIAQAMADGYREGGKLRAFLMGLNTLGGALFSDEYQDDAVKVKNLTEKLDELYSAKKRIASMPEAGQKIAALFVDPRDRDADIATAEAQIAFLRKKMADATKAPEQEQEDPQLKKKVKAFIQPPGNEKSLLSGRLKDIENIYSQERDTTAYHERYMQELRAQDVVDIATYESFKASSLENSRVLAERAYDAEIAILTKAKAAATKENDRAEIDNQLKDKRAAKERARLDAAQAGALQILDLSAAQSELNKNVKEWIIQQDQAASQFQFEIDLCGKSTIEVAKLTAARRIQLQVEEEIRQKQKESSVPIDRSGFDKAAAAAIAKSNALYDQADAQQRDPWFNMQESIRRYGEEASNVGAQIGNAMTDAFHGAEDAFVQFTMTGKLSFKSLASSILADIARIESRKAISGLLSMATKYLFGGGAEPSSGPGSSGWDGYGNMTEVDGKFAAGGTVLGGSTYLVGERGPEIFKPAGAGTIIPNSKIGGAGGGVEVNVIVNADTGQSQSDSKGDGREMERLGKLIGDKVRETIIQEKRMGGMLA
jgi:lambda family phage tail tape measure protein